MTLSEYLEHLTDNNWHTLRRLIELERGALEPGSREEEEAFRGYLAAQQLCLERYGL